MAIDLPIIGQPNWGEPLNAALRELDSRVGVPGPEGDKGDPGEPGKDGTVTPEMITLRDESVAARDQAEVYSATTTALQDSAVSGLVAGGGLAAASVRRAASELSGMGVVVTDPARFKLGDQRPTTWETPDGTGIVVHPSVRFFPSGFRGYRWWAAITPYAGSNNQVENPCIMVSHNGSNWTTPPGVVNPLYPPQNQGYNSDTHLVPGPDGKLYLFFRDFSVSGTFTEKIMLMHSSDGVSWSAPVMIIGNVSNVQRVMSPAVWHDGSNWVLLGVEILASPRRIVRYVASDPYGPWVQDSAPVTVSPEWTAGRSPWHLDAQIIGDQIVAVVDDSVANSGPGDLYLMTSSDGGKSFTRSTEPLAVGKYYRTCLLPVVTEGGIGLDVWVGHHAPWGVTRALALPKVTAANGISDTQAAALDRYSMEKLIPPFILGDDFDRPDQAGLGVATSGQEWSSSMGALRVVGGRAGLLVDGNSRSTVSAGRSDYVLTADLYTQKTPTHQVWVVIRYVDSNNYLRVGFNGGAWVMQRVAGGVATVLQTSPYFTSSDGRYRVTVRAVGAQIVATLPEAQNPFVSQDEPLGQSSTVVGIQIDKVGMYVDNLIIKTA